jgi:hypothetical protein
MKNFCVENEGIINYSDVEEVNNIGKFSFKIRYK